MTTAKTLLLRGSTGKLKSAVAVSPAPLRPADAYCHHTTAQLGAGLGRAGRASTTNYCIPFPTEFKSTRASRPAFHSHCREEDARIIFKDCHKARPNQTAGRGGGREREYRWPSLPLPRNNTRSTRADRTTTMTTTARSRSGPFRLFGPFGPFGVVGGRIRGSSRRPAGSRLYHPITSPGHTLPARRGRAVQPGESIYLGRSMSSELVGADGWPRSKIVAVPREFCCSAAASSAMRMASLLGVRLIATLATFAAFDTRKQDFFNPPPPLRATSMASQPPTGSSPPLADSKLGGPIEVSAVQSRAVIQRARDVINHLRERRSARAGGGDIQTHNRAFILFSSRRGLHTKSKSRHPDEICRYDKATSEPASQPHRLMIKQPISGLDSGPRPSWPSPSEKAAAATASAATVQQSSAPPPQSAALHDQPRDPYGRCAIFASVLKAEPLAGCVEMESGEAALALPAWP